MLIKTGNSDIIKNKDTIKSNGSSELNFIRLDDSKFQNKMEEAQENYRIVDSAAKLLERFAIGEKQVTVEYQELDSDNRKIWFQIMKLSDHGFFTNYFGKF